MGLTQRMRVKISCVPRASDHTTNIPAAESEKQQLMLAFTVATDASNRCYGF